MNRNWLYAMALLAGLLVFPAGVTFADTADDLDTYREETNAGMGVLSSRIASLEIAGKFVTKADIRVRHEMFTQKGVTFSGPKHKWNRGRSRIRLRFGVSKDVSSEVNAAFGLASGSITDPTSTNQTLGDKSAAGFTEKGIYIDYAFLEYLPSFMQSKLTVTGGKMKNPLKYTAANWDSDTNPEGIFGNVAILPNTYLRGGWWVLKENEGKDGVIPYKEYGMNVFQFQHGLNLAGFDTTAAVGYQFVPFTTVHANTALFDKPSKDLGNLASLTIGPGNVAKIKDFKVLDYLLQLKKSGYTLILHWCRNTNSFDIPSCTGKTNNNENAYLAELAWGKIAAKGDYSWNLRWGYLEPNSVLAYYPDSDAEFTNRKYIRASVGYGLADGLELDLTHFGIKRVNYDVISAESREPMMRTQVDLVVKL